MPTRERLDRRAQAQLAQRPLSLHEAAERAGYASETMRKLMWSADPPPMRKYRGRWQVDDPAALAAWIAKRDGQAAS